RVGARPPRGRPSTRRAGGGRAGRGGAGVGQRPAGPGRGRARPDRADVARSPAGRRGGARPAYLIQLGAPGYWYGSPFAALTPATMPKIVPISHGTTSSAKVNAPITMTSRQVLITVMASATRAQSSWKFSAPADSRRT